MSDPPSTMTRSRSRACSVSYAATASAYSANGCGFEGNGRVSIGITASPPKKPRKTSAMSTSVPSCSSPRADREARLLPAAGVVPDLQANRPEQRLELQSVPIAVDQTAGQLVDVIREPLRSRAERIRVEDAGPHAFEREREPAADAILEQHARRALQRPSGLEHLVARKAAIAAQKERLLGR